jgi:hypothetical protein
MTVFFVDTSALAKRYLHESGSAWVQSWIEPVHGNVIIIAEIAIVEMKSLLARRQRENSLTAQAAALLWNDFLIHAQKEYLRITLDEQSITIATRLIDIYPLRALDAVQLASAIRGMAILGDPVTMISADTRLIQAALFEGFSADDPNNHP